MSKSTIFQPFGGLWESTPDSSAPGGARFLPVASQCAERRTRSTGTGLGPAIGVDLDDLPGSIFFKTTEKYGNV